MKTIDVIPYGYCSGVYHALSIATSYASTHKEEEIYLLGMLVHNEDSVSALANLGVHILDERKAPLLDQLKALPDGVTVIFSAHGHPDEYETIAKAKHIKTIDTTCRFVLETHEDAKEVYKRSEDIIYIGSKGHLEAIGFLANLPRVSFFDVKSKTFEIKGELHAPIMFSQTTLGNDELIEATDIIKKTYPEARLAKGRCFATSMRQEALAKALQEEGVDALIVLGSTTSNNSKKLAEIGINKNIPTYLCLNLEDVKRLDLSSYRCIVLASGASTSRECYLQVKSYLSALS